MDGIVILIKTYPWKFHMSSLEHKWISILFFFSLTPASVFYSIERKLFKALNV